MDDHGPWRSWFAWRPVRTDDRGWVWCELVWRRREYTPTPVELVAWWRYRVVVLHLVR
jgi:hypothetical protein